MSDTRDSQNRISRRAHEIWEREGRPHGRHDEHWAQAEAEIKAEDNAKSGAAPEKPASARKPATKGTRAAAEDLSAVGTSPTLPRTPAKAAGKTVSKASKTGPVKPADPKPARAPRKDSGKSAAAR